MGKSFSFELEDGSTIEAVDGTELVKSLTARLEESETDRERIAKALDSTVSLLKSQQTAISDLKASVAKLASQGRGRKSVLSVAEPPAMAKAESAPELNSAEILSKAMDAFKAGRLTAVDVSRAEIAIANGVPVNPAILARLG